MSQAEKILWPGWKTGEVIGKGSFGAVYEIENPETGEFAALKKISIPQDEGELEEMYGDGFTRETVASAYTQRRNDIMSEYAFMKELGDCPNVVRCEDFRFEPHDDGIGWNIYIKMERLTPLTKIVSDDMPQEQLLQLAADLCRALEHCKERGILHRDIKPQNIFVNEAGEYKLGDFGIAKVAAGTTGGTKIGTYKYMAPEVYNNQPYGAGADIYSLGLVLYWLLNRRRMPFLPLPPAVPSHGDEDRAKERRFAGEPLPAPCRGSEDLKRIVLKACAFDPKERYRSAAQMRQDLEAVIRGEPICLEVVTGEGTADPLQTQKAVHRQFCRNCGAPVFPNVKFCRKCGAEVVAVSEEPELAEPYGDIPGEEPDSPEQTAGGIGKLLSNKKLLLGGIIGCGVLVAALILLLVLVPLVRYNNAVEMMENGDYQGAVTAFEKLGDYKDSESRITACRYSLAVLLLNEGSYDAAQTEFALLGEYLDSPEMITMCRYGKGMECYNAGSYDAALAIFQDLGDYEDSPEMILLCRLGQADDLLEAGKYDEALAAYQALGDYPEKVKACKYGQASELMEAGEYAKAIPIWEQVGDYQDAREQNKECKYKLASGWLSEGNVVEAYELLTSLGNYKDSPDKAKSVEKTYNRIKNKPKLFRSGSWWDLHSQRCHMNTTVTGTNTMYIEIYWSSSAAEHSEWHFNCTWDPQTGKLNYTGGQKYNVFYPEFSYNPVIGCIYDNGTGYFYYQNGYMYWVDNVHNTGSNCYFEYSY